VGAVCGGPAGEGGVVRLGGYGAGVAGLCGASACVYLGVGVMVGHGPVGLFYLRGGCVFSEGSWRWWGLSCRGPKIYIGCGA